MLQRKEYPSDLTEHQWKSIKRFIPKSRKGGRPRTTDVREVVNAILYTIRTGCAWRYLPSDFPKWQTVYDYFRHWSEGGVWEKLCHYLTKKVRKKAGRKKYPSAIMIDSQSVKAQFGESRGYDGFKKVRGRKRHIMVDAMGTVIGVRVTPANVGDSKDGIKLLEESKKQIKKHLKVIYVDGGYRDKFEGEVLKKFKAKVKIIKAKTVIRASTRPQDKGSKRKVIIRPNIRPMRWIVERTIAWFNHFRRLAKDFERKTSHSKTMIYIAMTSMLLRKL